MAAYQLQTWHGLKTVITKFLHVLIVPVLLILHLVFCLRSFLFLPFPISVKDTGLRAFINFSLYHLCYFQPFPTHTVMVRNWLNPTTHTQCLLPPGVYFYWRVSNARVNHSYGPSYTKLGGKDLLNKLAM